MLSESNKVCINNLFPWSCRANHSSSYWSWSPSHCSTIFTSMINYTFRSYWVQNTIISDTVLVLEKKGKFNCLYHRPSLSFFSCARLQCHRSCVRSSAWAEMVMQRSLRSRCDTLTVACCEGWGGRGGQPGLFLKPLWESSLRSAQMLHYAAHLLTSRALTIHYFILPPPQLHWRTCRVKIKGRNC